MARRPRLIPDEALVEITRRTVGARFLMRPSETLNRRILGLLGRALHLYPVTLFAFAFLSNHYHLLARAIDGAALASFLRYFNGELAKVIQQHARWSLPVWQGRAAVIEVIDDDAAADRLRYILAHGAKEGLVASPLDWPGVTSARALVGREPLVGTWRDETLASRLRRTGRKVHAFEVDHVYPIALAPLPGWDAAAPDERHARAAALVATIERDARIQHPRPLGVRAVLAQDPLTAPAAAKRSRQPWVHASSPIAYLEFRAARRALIRTYRACNQDLARGAGTWLPGPAHLPSLFCRRPWTYVGFDPPPR